MRPRGAIGVLAVSLASGCSWPEDPRPPGLDPPPSGCSDMDGDAFGIGGDCLGPDCDDLDPTVSAQRDCVVRCAKDPRRTGCPCDLSLSPATESCYAGPPETMGVGACGAGLQTCLVDRWSPCEGQVLPGVEVCNLADDDCDGGTDDGVSNEWADCDLSSFCDCVGEACNAFVPEIGENVAPCAESNECLTLLDPALPGTYSVVFQADFGAWTSLKFLATVPPDSALRFDVRTAEIAVDLADAEWIALGEAPPDESPLDLSGAIGYGYPSDTFLEVRVTFTTAGEAPTLRKLGACMWTKL